MKLIIKFNIVFLLLISLFTLKAQVGIGTVNPDTGTILDLMSSNKGLLIPRVGLLGTTDTTTIPVSAIDEGVIVYNLENAGIAPGNVIKDTFYIWTDNAWQAIGEISDIKEGFITRQVFSGRADSNFNYSPANSFSAWVPVNFQTEFYDPKNTHSAGIFTIPETGLYSVSGNLGLIMQGQTTTGVQTVGIRIMNITTNTEIAASYLSCERIFFYSVNPPIHWIGELAAGTQIQVQFRALTNVAANQTYYGSMLINQHL